MEYKSVVISGLPSSGKGVLAKKISEKCGWKLFSIGDIWRQRWKERYPDKEISFEDYWKDTGLAEQKLINEKAREIVSTGKIVGDFRFAICCKGIHSLFIFLTANLESRAERALKSGKYSGKNRDEVKSILLQRERDEVKWGRKIYGKEYDFRDRKHYDLIIDNSNLDLVQELEKVEEKLKANL